MPGVAAGRQGNIIEDVPLCGAGATFRVARWRELPGAPPRMKNGIRWTRAEHRSIAEGIVLPPETNR